MCKKNGHKCPFIYSKAHYERFFSLPLRAGSGSSVNKLSIPKQYGESVNDISKNRECSQCSKKKMSTLRQTYRTHQKHRKTCGVFQNISFPSVRLVSKLNMPLCRRHKVFRRPSFHACLFPWVFLFRDYNFFQQASP